jgi:hypothetical protein
MSDRFNLGSFVEATAFAALDEVFATFHSDDGFARPSRYEAYFFPPIGKSQTNIMPLSMAEMVGDGTARKTALRCQSFEFPGRNLDTTEDTNIYGPVRNIVSGYSYAETTAVFQCSSDMKEKRFFETWQRLAYNPQTWAVQYYNDYSGSIKIFQLDETDRQRYGVELVEVFPKTIAAQALDYSTINAIHTVSVTFSYRYWKDLKDEADLPKPLGERMLDAVLDTVESKITSAIPKVLQKL